MMEWIATAGTLAPSRLARGQVAVGATDDIDLAHPPEVGRIAILRARVEWGVAQVARGGRSRVLGESGDG
jgi:acyl-CoA hydrolase